MTNHNVFEAPELPKQDKYREPYTDYSKFRDGTGIVIDYGVDVCKAGWNTENEPRLVFENMISKFRNKKGGPGNTVLVGSDIYVDSIGYSNIKTAFDGGLINNFDVVENTLDYIFLNLGIEGDKVDHPVVMTEPISNLTSCRKGMSELLFEGYRIPKVAYGIEPSWNYWYNKRAADPEKTGLIIDTGSVSTHLIPVVDGVPQLKDAKRINVGGNMLIETMMKLLQLKYPTFPTKINLYQTKSLLYEHGYYAKDYQREIQDILSRDKLEKEDRIIQFSYKAIEEKSEQEKEEQAERRRENAKKMSEIAARVQKEKLQRNIELLELLRDILANDDDDSPRFKQELKNYGIKTRAELEAEAKKVEIRVRKATDKDFVETKEQPVFDLVDVPDEQLGPEELKEKRKQKLLKANMEARDKLRAAKEEEKRLLEEDRRKDEELRINSFEVWLSQLKDKRTQLVDRMRQKRAMKKELSDRKSAASQQRMRSIADLAGGEGRGDGGGGGGNSGGGGGVGRGGSTRRRYNAGNGRGDDDDDKFGENDSDWDIYLDISKEEGVGSDEEDIQAELVQLNEKLCQYDAEYLRKLDDKAKDEIRSSLMYRYYYGNLEPILDDPALPETNKNGTDNDVSSSNELLARSFQMHLNVERIRVPEIIFDPSIIGVEQMGLIELISHIYPKIASSNRSTSGNGKGTRNIFINMNGGAGVMEPSSIKGFEERLRAELIKIWPVGDKINITTSSSPNDGWKGASLWSNSKANCSTSFLTRKIYDEYGSDYFVTNEFSNLRYSQE